VDRKEVIKDVWDIMRTVYNISSDTTRSQKQEEFLNKIADYVGQNKKEKTKEKQ